MNDFESIKRQITPEAENLTNEIWEYHLEKKMWIPTSALFLRFGKEEVLSVFNSLTSNLLIEDNNNGERRCRLTPIGKYLTAQGDEALSLMVGCAEFIQKGLHQDPEFKKYSSQDLMKEYGWTQSQIDLLSDFIWHSPITGGGGGGSQNSWEFSVGYRLRNDFILEKDLRNYILGETIKDSGEPLPVTYDERIDMQLGRNSSTAQSPFSFITDTKLKEIVELDWKEAQIVYKGRAWKSCLILCGSIIEGILINELRSNLSQAEMKYCQLKRKPSAPPLTKWELTDLVSISSILNLFPRSVIHLSSAVREFRNLIHPGRQVRENIEVSEEQAEIAVNTIISLLKFKDVKVFLP